MRHPQHLELWNRPPLSPTYFGMGADPASVWETPFMKVFNVAANAGPKKLAQINSRDESWIFESCITPNGTFLAMADEAGVRVLKLNEKLGSGLEAEKLISVNPETLIQKFWEEQTDDKELNDQSWGDEEEHKKRQVTAMTATNSNLYFSQNEFVLKKFNFRRKNCELIAKRSKIFFYLTKYFNLFFKTYFYSLKDS